MKLKRIAFYAAELPIAAYRMCAASWVQRSPNGASGKLDATAPRSYLLGTARTPAVNASAPTIDAVLQRYVGPRCCPLSPGLSSGAAKR